MSLVLKSVNAKRKQDLNINIELAFLQGFLPLAVFFIVGFSDRFRLA